MKVVFACHIYDFHKEYCYNIAEEVESRGGTAIFTKNRNEHHEDADFTIQPDEAYSRHGGKGVWINHALPIIPQNKFYLERPFIDRLKRNSDYIFTFSEAWAKWHKMFGLPVYVCGLPKLDKLHNNLERRGTVIYAPTHHLKNNVYSGNNIDVNELKSFCLANGFKKFISRGHPAFNKSDLTLADTLKEASLVISDYSSVGLESIILNIPTILLGNTEWKQYDNQHISGLADEAATRVYDLTELKNAIKFYAADSSHKEPERIKHSNILCDFQGSASKKMVDLLEGLM